MRTLDEIMNTPVLLLTEEEIMQLSPKSQRWAHTAQAVAKRERDCPGHEPEAVGTSGERMRGWHRMRCKHCGMDMTIDSGD
jgi:transposase-like protein